MPDSSHGDILIENGYIVCKEADEPFILKIDHITKVAYLIIDDRIEFSMKNGKSFDIPCPFNHFETLISAIVNLKK